MCLLVLLPPLAMLTRFNTSAFGETLNMVRAIGERVTALRVAWHMGYGSSLFSVTGRIATSRVT